jgi:predicted transcriptional regulator
MHGMEAQVTLRLPRALDRALVKAAKARGLKKSHLVREAVALYLARDEQAAEQERLRAVLREFAGSVALDHEEVMQDPIARHIYEMNWRE